MDGLDVTLAEIKSKQQLHLDLFMQVWESGRSPIYPLDLLVFGVIKRSLSLIHGFYTLMEAKNFSCSSALLRLELDNCLRLQAAWLVEDCHDFSTKVLAGLRIDKLKDRNGNRMTDAHLVKSMSVQFPWVEGVYKDTCSYVHLSDKHILSTFTSLDLTSKTATITISTFDEHVKDSKYLHLASSFRDCIDVMVYYVNAWIVIKRSLPTHYKS